MIDYPTNKRLANCWKVFQPTGDHSSQSLAHKKMVTIVTVYRNCVRIIGCKLLFTTEYHWMQLNTTGYN